MDGPGRFGRLSVPTLSERFRLDSLIKTNVDRHNLYDMAIDIKENEVAYKKKVGKLGDTPIVEIGLKGGLHLIVAARGGQGDVLGVGSHRAIARHIAKKRESEIEWTDLSKSDHIAPEHFAFCLPQYEALTDAFRARQGLK
jgi:hypothetical protein